MPYTVEELQDVDFYQEFTARPTKAYFNRISRSAANRNQNDNPTPFAKDGVDYISFEDIATSLGLEEADFNSHTYSLLAASLDGKSVQYLLNILNAPFNEFMNNPENLGDFHAGSGPPQNQGAPPQYQVEDIAGYIRTLLENKGRHKAFYPNYKSPKLENIINRDITELSESLVAATLPAGVNNGNVITTDDANDTRKWLVENNQKRIFPNLQSFWGTTYSFSDLVTLTESDVDRIPNGDPID